MHGGGGGGLWWWVVLCKSILVFSLSVGKAEQFEHFECRICQNNEESQKHGYECVEISKLRKIRAQKIKYENIFEENKRRQIQVARDFTENMKILNKVD